MRREAKTHPLVREIIDVLDAEIREIRTRPTGPSARPPDSDL